MEIVSCAENNKDENQWISALHSFNSLNIDKFSLVEGNSEICSADKLRLFEVLLTKLKETHNNQLQFEILQTLRLATRDEVLLHKFSDTDNVKFFVNKLKEVEVTSDNKLTNEEEKSFSELTKIIVNICLKNRENIPVYEICRTIELADYFLTCLSNTNLSPNSKFPICRLLFYFSIESSFKSFLFSKNILQRIYDQLNGLNVKIDIERTFATELLDLLYVSTTHFGPLDGPTLPNEEESNVFNQLVPIFQEYLLKPINDLNFLKLKENTIKCLVNIPASSTDRFQPEPTLESLISFLLYNLTYANAGTPTTIVPVLINLTAIARAIPYSRPIILNAVFPNYENYDISENGIDPPTEVADKSTPQGKLISYMTSSSTAVAHCSSDFVFALCGDNADAMVRLVGMGSAAGLLSNRGLLGSISSVAAKKSRTKSTKEMTEEDAKHLVELIERLEKGGMIKVMRSSDQNNNNNDNNSEDDKN